MSEIVSLGVVPEDLLDDEDAVRSWTTQQLENASAVCLRIAQTGPEHAPYLVTVADVLCDWPDIEGLPVTYHELGALDSILHAT